jgi:pyridoxamine 5'-phosphate oxidase family protein
MFTQQEVIYLKSQRLARIATVAPDGQPDVAVVGFRFDGERFTVGGRDIRRTLKYKNVVAGNSRVALVIDDLESVSPWVVRGVKVHGTAEIIERTPRPGSYYGPFYLVITPDTRWSWGIESGEPDGKRSGMTKTVHSQADTAGAEGN